MTCIAVLEGHTGSVWKARWNGSTLATSGGDGSVRLWEHVSAESRWRCTTQLEGPQNGTIRSVTWKRDGTALVSASFDTTACVWEKSNNGQWECDTTLDGHKNEVKDAAFSASGDFIATCSRDKTIWMWEKFDDMDEYECCAILTSHSQDVKCLQWHPTVDVLASGSYDNTICLFALNPDSGDWDLSQQLVGHESTVWGIAFNADGTMLASCSDDKTVKIWLRKDGEWSCISTLSGMHPRPIFDISWNRTSGQIATACGDNNVRVFNVTTYRDDTGLDRATLELACVLSGHSQDVNSVAWQQATVAGKAKNPDASEQHQQQELLLASASDDETVRIWTVEKQMS